MSQIVVFDLGMVLVQWHPERTQLGDATVQEWQAFIDRTDFWAFNQRLDAGEPLSEARQWFAEHYGEDVAFVDRYISRFANSLTGPVEGMADVVADLKDRGVRLAGLSNWPGELFHHATTAVPLLDALDDIVVSGHVKMRKPDPKIYRLMLSRFGVAPREVIFIDDVQANIDAAADLGIDGIVFTGADNVRAELVSRGLL